MIIDIHNHVGRAIDGKSQTISQLRANMKRLGITHSVIFPFNEPGNLVEASRRLLEYRGRNIIPFLRFDPKTPNPDAIAKELEENEYKGVKLHPKAQKFDAADKRYYDFYKTIQRFKIPLLFHTKKETKRNMDPDRIAALARKFPKLNIILGHYASMSMDALAYIKTRNNLYAETSIFSSDGTFDLILKATNPKRILFGSDSPYSSQEIELMKIKIAKITRQQREDILYNNAARLLDM